jgi:hypothetical protein
MTDEEYQDQNGGTPPPTRLQRWQDTLQSKFCHPAPDGSRRQRDDFTSRVFLGLPYPMPVVDVFDTNQYDRVYLLSMHLVFQIFVVRIRSLGLYLTGSIAAPFVGLIYSTTGIKIPLPPGSGWFVEQTSWVCATSLT